MRQWSGTRDPRFSPFAIGRKEGRNLEKINRKLGKKSSGWLLLRSCAMQQVSFYENIQ